MDERIAEEARKHGMSYSQYLRHIIREHESTPFECNDPVLCVDENGKGERNEGAA
jgi:hypothetical protein